MSSDPGRVVYASRGYTTHDYRFLSALVDSGWEVHHARFDGGTVQLDQRPLPPGVIECRWLGASVPLDEASPENHLKGFTEALKQAQPDVVLAGPIPTVGWVATSVSTVPVVVMSWASDLLIDINESAVARSRACEALRGAAATFIDCQTLADIAISLGASDDRLLVLPWGVDLDAFPFAPLDLRPGPIRLLSLRSLEPLYEPQTIIRAVSQVRNGSEGPDVILTMAGGGSLEHDLRELCEALGIKDIVTFAGRVPESEISDLLATHDVHVSAARSDGTSLSLLQAMSVGRPSIVVDLASNAEWVTDTSVGWRFPLGNEHVLAEAILDASSRRTALSDMGYQCRKAVEQRADWSKNKSAIGTLLVSLLNG